MTLVESVTLRRVLDSRGNPTVEADVFTEAGGFGRAAAPSGASTGAHEAVERPPQEAIAAAREHAVPRLEGAVHVGDQRAVDRALHAADGTDDFSRIGVNAAVAVSMAAAKAAADTVGIPLFQHLGGTFRGAEVSFPVPLGNVLGGGEHAAEATAIQEFLAVPVGAPSVGEAVFANAAVHGAVADRLAARGVAAGKGDEGAWAPQISDETAFEVVQEAAAAVADERGFDIRLGVDVAATELYDPETETYTVGETDRSPAEHREWIAGLIDEYELAYVEDPLAEEDFDGFAALTADVGARAGPGTPRTVVCGDDLYVTNTDRIERGIESNAGNAVLIKPNQIGTLTDAFDAISVTTRAGFTPVVSHRSGETEDTTIAHLAVAADAPFVKTGAVGGERTAKLNELIRIAEDAV